MFFRYWFKILKGSGFISYKIWNYEREKEVPMGEKERGLGGNYNISALWYYWRLWISYFYWPYKIWLAQEWEKRGELCFNCLVLVTPLSPSSLPLWSVPRHKIMIGFNSPGPGRVIKLWLDVCECVCDGRGHNLWYLLVCMKNHGSKQNYGYHKGCQIINK